MDIYYTHNKELKKATLNVSEEKPLDFVFLGPIPQDNILGSAILVGRYDTNLDKVKYQLEGISPSGDMKSLNRQNIIDFCLDNKPNIDPNSLGIYPNWQTIKVVPNPEERGPLELPDAYEYLEDVSITSCSYIEGREIIKEETNVQDFDYAVIKYKWTNQGGQDLDTRTFLSTPNRVSTGVVGWGRLSSDNDYLSWNNDNTGSGVEGILVNVISLKRDFPSQKEFIISLGAFWYNTRSSGDLSIEVNTYKGGTMSKSGYDWQNTNGTLVQNLSFNTNSSMQTQSASTLGSPLGYLSYNTDTNLGVLSNVPIRNGDVVEPLPPEEEEEEEQEEEVYPLPQTDTFEFKLLNPEIRLFFPEYIEAWYLEDEFGVSIHPGKSNTDYLSSDLSNGETYIRISNVDGINRSYKLWINNAPYLKSSVVVVRDQSITSSMVVTKFTTNIPAYEFNLRTTNLIVPDTLPSYINEIRFSYSEVFNQNISGWDVSNLVTMDYMFYSAVKFNQDLSSWDVEHLPTKPYGFDEEATSWTLPKPVWTVPKPNYTPLEFTTKTTNISTHTIELKDAVGQWFVFKGRILLGSGTGSANTTDYYQIQDVPAGVNTYQVYVESPSVKIKSYTYSGSDSLTVNSFCGKVRNQTFELPNCNLTVPTTLPTTLTALSNMFSSCNLFNQDISSWNTKNVISMSYMFSGCSKFNQDISEWNTQNVIDMQYMFKGSNFNRDISAWDVSKVNNMSHMFESALEFNQPIDIWNVSKVTNMERMFSNAISFNQDLSSWDVVNIPTEPNSFSDTIAWTAPKPVWGTKGIKVVEPLKWTMTNTRNPPKELSATVIIEENPEKAVWSLYRNDVLVADSTGLKDSTVSKHYYSSYHIYLELYGSGQPTNTYALYAEEVLSVSLGHSSFYDVPVDGDIVINSFGTGVSKHTFNYQNCNLTVPTALPRYVRSLKDMFANQKKFNQDLSTWDVSLIDNMDKMFFGTVDYNQDLSKWNVKRIKAKPLQFDQGATSWTKPRPIWGGANFTNVDLTGQSGVYLTLRKNGGAWITYNLSDPNFNQNEFLKFVSYNESNTAIAFKGYSANSNETFTAICGLTKDGFARTPVSSTDTIGKLYLDDKQSVVPQVLNIESTELIAKPTEGIPREYDLYYSLTGANYSETVIVKSAASVKVEDFIAPGTIPRDYILRYDLNGNTSDLSENNYQNVQEGVISFVEGRKPGTQAMKFENGSLVTDILNIDSPQLTVTCWLKGSQETAGGVLRLSDGVNGFHFFYNNGAGWHYDFSDVNTDGSETMIGADRVQYNDTWTFVTLILDRLSGEKAIVIKVNNEEKAYSSLRNSTGNYENSSLTVGKYGTEYPFVGCIQDLRFYSRILTSEEQTQLFNE